MHPTQARLRRREWSRGASALIVGTTLVAACAPRGAITIDPSAAEIGAVHEILVASTRRETRGSAVLSAGRSRDLGFFDFAVSVPPERTLGTVTFPSATPPEPETDFLTVSARRLGGATAFEATVNARVGTLGGPEREVIVFVHGYNTTFAEGLYRHAQLTHDFVTSAVSVSYAWASAGALRSYAFDRESVLFARDGLEATLAALARSDATRIVVVGHSMGALLLMETLRQIAIRGEPGLSGKLEAVVLIAPDIDPDVFATLAAPVSAAEVPIFAFVSSGDRALRLSSFIAGRTARIGTVSGAVAEQSADITFIDITEVEANGDRLGHFKAGSSPAVIALLSGMGSAGLALFSDNGVRAIVPQIRILTPGGMASTPPAR